MIFLNAFILGGLLCALFQLVMVLTKLKPPALLIAGLFIGALITPFGISQMLGSWGGAGFLIMVVGAGEAILNSFLALFAGNPTPLLIVLGIFCALIVIGIIAGMIYTSLHPNKKAESE